jgi:F-type H+-transporting ATPase subunit a
MNQPLLLLFNKAVTGEILLSLGMAFILCIAGWKWMKSIVGRVLVIGLILSAWWSAIDLTGDGISGELSLENIDTLPIFTVFGITIGGTIFFSWIVMGALVLLSWLATRNLKTSIRVSKLQTAMEMIVMTIRSQIKEVSGDNPIRYMPMMGTFFLFIGMSNLMTIIPWFRAPTASLSTTLAFSLCVFCAMPIYGIRNQGIIGYLKKYIEPTPVMLPMNIISDFSSTFSLAFRLYGNMLSGAIIASVLMMLAPFLIPLPLQILGLITGTIQAYIFALLAIVYVSAVTPKKPFIDYLTY